MGTRSSAALSELLFSRTKANTSMVAITTRIPAMGKGRRYFVLPMRGRLRSRPMRRARPSVLMMAPRAPMVLMTPFASERYSPGMVSGIRATTGPRTDCLKMFRPKTMMSIERRALDATWGSVISLAASEVIRAWGTAKGMREKQIADRGRSTTM